MFNFMVASVIVGKKSPQFSVCCNFLQYGTSCKDRLFPPWILESHRLVTETPGEQGSTTLFNPSAGIQNYYINHDLRMPASNWTICFWWKFDSRLYGTMVSIAQEGKQKQSICCENMLRFIYNNWYEKWCYWC